MAPIIIGVLVLVALYVGTKRLSGLQVSAVVVFTLLGICLVVFPALSTAVANFLGIGRGTDLVFYFAVLGGLFVTSNFYFRFRRNEEALIALSRRMAIDRAEVPSVGKNTVADEPSLIKDLEQARDTANQAKF